MNFTQEYKNCNCLYPPFYWALNSRLSVNKGNTESWSDDIVLKKLTAGENNTKDIFFQILESFLLL